MQPNPTQYRLWFLMQPNQVFLMQSNQVFLIQPKQVHNPTSTQYRSRFLLQPNQVELEQFKQNRQYSSTFLNKRIYSYSSNVINYTLF